MEGVIKMVNPKGYGFISVEGRDKDLFFHATECLDGIFKDLKVGDQVKFEEIGVTDKGEVAVSVSLL